MQQAPSPLDYNFFVEERDPETNTWFTVKMCKTKAEAIADFTIRNAEGKGFYKVTERNNPDFITSTARATGCR